LVCWFYFKTLFQNVREYKEESWDVVLQLAYWK
jgi:hypothetical protein